MSLDVPAIRIAITQDGIRHIPGLRIFQTERLRVRAAISARSYKASPQDDQTVLTSDSEDAAKPQSLDQRPRDSQRAKRRGCVRSAPDPLRVPIKPIWGDQKVLRYYRQALASLQPHDAAETGIEHVA